jgi:uncharacterized membrane protein YgcG|tara:strand:+ start:1290 stop:1574 length:285 start_codon:yes stop_codon:yes gene_type:complete
MVREELYTTGGDFTLPNGEDYIGPYHIHITQGAMVGGFHELQPHDILTPSTERSINFVETVINQLSSSPNQRSTPISSGSSSGASGGSSGGGGY